MSGMATLHKPSQLFVGPFVGSVLWTEVGYRPVPRRVGLGSQGQHPRLVVWRSLGDRNGYRERRLLYRDQLALGIGHINVGATQLTVLDPGTLGLFETGLMGIAGMFRRKRIGSQLRFAGSPRHSTHALFACR